MKELEKLVYELIGRTSKGKVSKYLEMTRPTLESRIEKGGWTHYEVWRIENAIIDKEGQIKYKHDNG